VVEKILSGEERLPPEWPVAGTTGYEFMNQVLGLLLDPAGLEELERLRAEMTGEDAPFAESSTPPSGSCSRGCSRRAGGAGRKAAG
jgi:maltooligosyltrehalose synthase